MTNKEAIKMLKSKMDGHTDMSYEWVETVRLAINALELADKFNWIDANDRLPTERDWYLGIFEDEFGTKTIPIVCDYIGEVTEATTIDGWILAHITNVSDCGDYYKKCRCCSWTYLPDPPKENWKRYLCR